MNEKLVIHGLLAAVLAAGVIRNIPVYDVFVRGAASGLKTAIQILPNLAAMLCAISMMQTSGLMDALCHCLAPLADWLRMPQEVLPLVLLRPLSGSASLAMLENLLSRFGPDSRIGLIASTVMGSSETIFYTVCVYMSALENRRTSYAIPCALAGALAGVWLCGTLF